MHLSAVGRRPNPTASQECLVLVLMSWTLLSPLPPIPCWGALHEGKEPVMINFTDTLAFLPN